MVVNNVSSGMGYFQVSLSYFKVINLFKSLYIYFYWLQLDDNCLILIKSVVNQENG